MSEGIASELTQKEVKGLLEDIKQQNADAIIESNTLTITCINGPTLALLCAAVQAHLDASARELIAIDWEYDTDAPPPDDYNCLITER